MSNLINQAIERVQLSEIDYDQKSMEVRNAFLLFTNFAGKANKFGNTSKNFNVVIPEELAERFENGELGLNVNVHHFGKGDEDEPRISYINVKCNMESQWPPLVTLYVDCQGNKSKKSLDEVTIGCLDRIDMERADLKINIRESKARPGWAVFYLRQLNVVQIKIPDFGGIYSEWDDDPLEPNPEILENNKELINE